MKSKKNQRSIQERSVHILKNACLREGDDLPIKNQVLRYVNIKHFILKTMFSNSARNTYPMHSRKTGSPESREDGRPGRREVRKSESPEDEESPEDGKSGRRGESGRREVRKTGSSRDRKSGSPEDGKSERRVSPEDGTAGIRDGRKIKAELCIFFANFAPLCLCGEKI